MITLQEVLIETLWNVKTNSRPVFRQAMRINRNIVECKENFGISEKPVETGINRNIMECQRSRTIFYIGILPHFPP